MTFNENDHPRNGDGTFADKNKNDKPGALPETPTEDFIHESYADGKARMEKLDKQLLEKAYDEHDQRVLGPGAGCYRVEAGTYLSAGEFEKLSEMDQNRYKVWGNDWLTDDEGEEAWNDPQRMDELAAESCDDGDAEVYFTEPQMDYADDFEFQPALEDDDAYAFSEGVSEAIVGHPYVEMEDAGDNRGRFKSPTHPDRGAVFAKDGTGWKVTYEGPDAPEPQSFQPESSIYPKRYDNTVQAAKAAVAWVDD